MKALILILWITFSSFAAATWVGLSPEIRFGYEFGDSKGFVLGIGCGVFYWTTNLPGPVVSINTVTEYSFGRKTLSQESDLTVGLLGLFCASLGEEFSYSKGFFTSADPFYQFSVSVLGIDGIIYKKYFNRNWHDLFLQAGIPIVLYSQGELLNLNLNLGR
jgi:hypothetical protein